MKRRTVLALGITSFVIVVVVALAAQKKPGLLLLDWASKGSAEAPPAAVLIELGLKDNQATAWKGKATVSGAKVVHREGYRFRKAANKDDKLVEPDGWDVSTHRPIRVPANQPAVAAMEGIASVGVVLHLSDVKNDASITVEPPEGKELQKATVKLQDVLSGKPQTIWDGAAVVRLITTATQLTNAKTEDDFPAACYGPDGTLWVAYIAYNLKDESRRIEQSPLKEQPKDFKEFYTPEFGDQLFIKYLRDGKWSDPIAVTDAKQDLVRCAVAVEGEGTAWVLYSANREKNYDIFSRSIQLPKDGGKPNLGDEQRLTTGATPDLSPVACTDQAGHLRSSYQNWRSDAREGLGAMFALLNCQQGKWTTGLEGPLRIPNYFFGGKGTNWYPAIAAGPDGEVATAYDVAEDGDYDVGIHVQDNRSARNLRAASSSKFEARPSLAYDAQGRLWIAYEEGPEKWGHDYGALDDNDGNPLYNERSVKVVCLQGDKLFAPAAELPTNPNPPPRIPYENNTGPKYERAKRYSGPKLGLDGKGRLWLTYRVKFGSRYSSHPGSYWLTFARRLDGDHWSEPIEVHQSDGYLDHRHVLLPHAAGGLLIVHTGDGRYTTPETLQSRVWTSYIDLPGDPVEPKLVPHEPGKKDEKLVQRSKDEAAAVKRIRDYRIDADGKKLRLLRGEFHRHTEISWDGGPDGSLEDMFRYAIDCAAMDWIGNADHDNGGGREYSWWLTQKLSDAYFVKERFTPMFTYERSVAYPHGHRNCMFAQRGVRTLPRLNEPDMQKRVGGVHADDAKMLFRYLKEMNGICASHTSTTTMGTDWRDNDPVVEPIVEIYQGDRMSAEHPEAPRAGYDPMGNMKPANIGGWKPDGFINIALKDKGYKLGFQSSSDHWSTHISYCIAVAETHDREGILAALKKRHSYGATDDIVVDFRSGDRIMGDELKTAKAPALQFHVFGTKPVARIDVLRDSEVVHTLKPGQADVKGDWSDPKPLEGVHYYYIRVVQEDEELAWASPIWINFSP